MLGALAAAAVAVAAVSSSAGVEAIGCRSQSLAGFPHAFTARSSVVVGPLTFVGLRTMGEATAESIGRQGGYKSPALIRPGHRVTVSIDSAARSYARLRYLHHAERPFSRLPHTVRFVACDRSRAGSEVDGRPVTFFSGFFALRRAPACVPVSIRVDGGAARHLRLPVAHGRCSRDASMGA